MAINPELPLSARVELVLYAAYKLKSMRKSLRVYSVGCRLIRTGIIRRGVTACRAHACRVVRGMLDWSSGRLRLQAAECASQCRANWTTNGPPAANCERATIPSLLPEDNWTLVTASNAVSLVPESALAQQLIPWRFLPSPALPYQLSLTVTPRPGRPRRPVPPPQSTSRRGRPTGLSWPL